MPSRREIPDSPRYDFATDKAYESLLEFGFCSFPITPNMVLEELQDYVVCLPWSKAKIIFHENDPFHLSQLNAEGRTIRSRETGKYYIVYDDVTYHTPERVTWTIMHELGHVLLGHLVDFEETALNRGGMTGKKYGVLEVEADRFAADFLMPPVILRYFKDLSVEKIVLLFGVSERAANKQYVQIHKATRPPGSGYEQKLVRNFYKFLVTECDDAIYRNIQEKKRTKHKYTSICRKCPECLSYIDDSKATYCPFCGSLIDRVYSNLSDIQQNTTLSGISHIRYPHAKKIKLSGGTKFARLTICPTCLNHAFSDNASYCLICGQPLENQNNADGFMQSIEECFCRNSGRETSSNIWYPAYEKRYQGLMAYHGALLEDDWEVYPYWEFTKWELQLHHSEVSKDLMSAILYSVAFMDDNDDIHIVTDTEAAQEVMENEQEILLSYLNKTDGILRNKVEVLVAYDV